MEEFEYSFSQSFDLPPELIIAWFIWTIVYIIGTWKVFVKAGQPGWASLIPFYNFYVIAKISGGPQWWFIFIPFLNIYWLFAVHINMARSFGRGTGFGVGLALLASIFYPILGFGKDRYIGPNGVADLTEDINSIGNNS